MKNPKANRQGPALLGLVLIAATTARRTQSARVLRAASWNVPMMKVMKPLLLMLPGVLVMASTLAAGEKVDPVAIGRIKREVSQHSEVMELLSWLTDVYGPRLTGSPNTRAAAEWTLKKLSSWGITNVHLEPWGPYERGWRSERFNFQAIAPQPFVIHAAPVTWSVSTRGSTVGPAVRFDVKSFADMKRFANKLKGAFLLMDVPQPTPAHFEPMATRLSDARLAEYALDEPPQPRRQFEIPYSHRLLTDDPVARHWLINEGIAALLFRAPGDGGTISQSGVGASAWSSKDEPDQVPIVKVSAESYGRIARILEKNIPVTLELDMQNRFYDDPEVFNIIAEIPGTDPKLKDEVVLLGAHFDSWTFGTGATDNAAGSVVLMEAMRILQKLNAAPRRTIRMALWTGEEQGSLGSKAYITKHYQKPTGDAVAEKSEYETFSVYFDHDGGTGRIRGIFNVRNPAVRPIFEAWLEPFKELGMKTVSSWDIGGGDQSAFERAGLPSFEFIQDPIDSRTQHSSADVYERILPEDLQFNITVLASFAWLAAERDERFPK